MSPKVIDCDNCGKPMTKDQAVVEHIVPLSRGGKNIETNLMVVHASCHRRKANWLVRAWRKFKYAMGQLTCFFNIHKWRPNGELTIDWRSKWEVYEVAPGICERCGFEVDEIRRDYYW